LRRKYISRLFFVQRKRLKLQVQIRDRGMESRGKIDPLSNRGVRVLLLFGTIHREDFGGGIRGKDKLLIWSSNKKSSCMGSD